jgi:hypothetical protein
MPVAEWFYAVNNQRQGPVTLEELQAKAASQELKATDLVWKPGFPNWTPAQKVPGIFLEKTLVGTKTPPVTAQASPPTMGLEQTQVDSPPPAAFATTKNVAEELAASLRPDPMQTQVDEDERKLFLTELPGTAAVDDEIESLPGDQNVPRQGTVLPRPAAPEPQASVPGFTFRWNLRGTEVSDPERSLCMSSGVSDPQLQQYLAWRRSLLLLLLAPAGLCVILGLIAMTMESGLLLFGKLVSFLRVVPLIAMAVAAGWGTMVWWKWSQSRRVLWGAWAVAVAMPLVLSLFPAAGQIDPQGADFLAISGLACFVHLLPAFWALFPGALRAALRLKEVMPEAVFPGWLAALAAVAHILVTAALFLPLNALAGNLALVLAGLCFLAAPVGYLWKVPVLLKPLNSDEEKTAVALAQVLNLALTVAGFVFLVIYLFTAEVMGKSLIGTTDAAWARPWNLHIYLFPLELFVRSILTTLVAADLFMLVNLAHWRQEQEFRGTPAAQVQEDFLTKVGQQIDL